MGGSYIRRKGEQKEYAAVETIRHICLETPRLVICSIHLSRIHKTFSVFVFGSISCLSLCLGCLYFKCQSRTKISFCFFIFVLSICFCIIFLVLWCIRGRQIILVRPFLFFFVVLILSFRFCLRCSRCQRRKILFFPLSLWFYPFFVSVSLVLVVVFVVSEADKYCSP